MFSDGINALLDELMTIDKNAEAYKLTCVRLAERQLMEREQERKQGPTKIEPSKKPVPLGYILKKVSFTKGFCKFVNERGQSCLVHADGTVRVIVHKPNTGWMCAEHFDLSDMDLTKLWDDDDL